MRFNRQRSTITETLPPGDTAMDTESNHNTYRAFHGSNDNNWITSPTD
jgi:hypothetical protein